MTIKIIEGIASVLLTVITGLMGLGSALVTRWNRRETDDRKTRRLSSVRLAVSVGATVVIVIIGAILLVRW